MTATLLTRPLPLTTAQHDVYLYLYEHARDCGFQPSLNEMCDRFDWSSRNAAAIHLKAIAKKGWIGLRASGGRRGESRAIEILRRPDGARFEGFADKVAGQEAAP
jgi:SOS-response transcriptional repressor LexA